MGPLITTRKERNVLPIIIFFTKGFMKHYQLPINNPREIQIFAKTISIIFLFRNEKIPSFNFDGSNIHA